MYQQHIFYFITGGIFILWILAHSFFVKIIYLWASGCLLWYCLETRTIENKNNLGTSEPFLVNPAIFQKRARQLALSKLLLRQPLYPGIPEISEEIESIISHFMQKYIKVWSYQIIPEPTISNSIESHLRKCLMVLLSRVDEIDLADVLVKTVLPLITKHLRLFVEAEQLVVGNKAVSFTDHSELSREVAAKYDHGRLHEAVLLSGNPMVAQKRYLRNWTTQVLSIILPNYYETSPLVLSLVTEVIINTTLLPLVSYISDPDFFNYLIIQASGSIIQRRRKIRRLKRAIRKQSNHFQVGARRLRLKDSQHSFEQYIHEIKKISNISDARRLRSELMVQRRQLEQTEAFDFEFKQYRERLQIAIITAEKRISLLSGTPFQHKEAVLFEQVQSLLQILSDSAAVSCFLEFMERKNRSRYLHFWLVVEGLKESQDDPLNAHMIAPFSDIVSDHTDFTAIVKSYFESVDNPLDIPKPLTNTINKFVNQSKDNLNPDLWVEARNAMLMAQEHVFDIMQNSDYSEFVNSEIYYRFLAQDVVSDHKSTNSSATFSRLEELGENIPAISKQPSYLSISSSSKSINSSPSPSIQLSVSSSISRDKNLSPLDLELDDPTYSDEEEVLFAPPGDLQLSESIDELNNNIEELKAQLNAINTLIKKAELVADQKQLKSLTKNHQEIEKAIHRKERQRDQYMSQEEDSKLFNRSRVSIDSFKISKEENTPDFAVYTIRIERLENGHVRSGWMVARRYREFAELHKQLKQTYPGVRSLKFPQKSIITSLNKNVLEYRRGALEEYLQSLFRMPEVCDSKMLRMFLSQQNITAPQMFNPKEVGKKWKQLLEVLGFEVNNSFNASNVNTNSSFSGPISEFLVELFSPNDDAKQQWLPKKTYISILEQLFGGALEKRIRLQLFQLFTPEKIYRKLREFRRGLEGKSNHDHSKDRRHSRARKPAYADRNQLKAEAGILLASMFPGYTPDIAVKRIFRILQNQSLNAHVIYTLLDEILLALKKHAGSTNKAT